MGIVDQKYVNAANNASFFNAGTLIAIDAERTLALFDETFSLEGLTEEQRRYLDERREQWREFVSQHFNDKCRRRAEYVPVSVAGPSRYDIRKMGKRADRIMQLSAEFAEKKQRFFSNTKKRLDALTPLEVELERLRNDGGRWEKISTSDPHAIEKMEAKLEGLEKLKSEATFGPTKRNLTVTIKKLKERIASAKAQKESPADGGWEFDGGEVVENVELDRLQIIFDERPGREMIDLLKSRGFRWSPRNKAWQRQLTDNARRAAKDVLLQK